MQIIESHSTGEGPTLFLAGHTAPAGTYRLLRTGQEIRLDQEDVLPATCDGHIAVYVRQPVTWTEIGGPREKCA